MSREQKIWLQDPITINDILRISADDALSWSKPQDISRSVKHAHWLNANSPGALIPLKRGPHKGRILASLRGGVPVVGKDGSVARSSVYFDSSC